MVAAQVLNGVGEMKWSVFVSALAMLSALGLSECVLADGINNSSENFFVFTPPARPSTQRELATKLLAQAEQFRVVIATDWLGSPLPDGVGRTLINVSYSATEENGLTWAKDHPDRSFHTIYLQAEPDRVNAPLAHEIAHIVLATRYPHPERLAPWVEEGVASQYDDILRRTSRKEMIAWFAQTKNWPSLQRVVELHRINSKEKDTYAAAVSLARFLVSKGGRTKFMEFAEKGSRKSWSTALREFYAIESLADLQQRWQQWIVRCQINPNRVTTRSPATLRSDRVALVPSK